MKKAAILLALLALICAGTAIVAGPARAMPQTQQSVHRFNQPNYCASPVDKQLMAMPVRITRPLCGGGYPIPPYCWSGISGAGWYGHFWAQYFYNPYILLYRQLTFVCGWNPFEHQVFVNDGIYPDADGNMTWGAIAYS